MSYILVRAVERYAAWKLSRALRCMTDSLEQILEEGKAFELGTPPPSILLLILPRPSLCPNSRSQFLLDRSWIAALDC
jgi:hypothetical protein